MTASPQPVDGSLRAAGVPRRGGRYPQDMGNYSVKSRRMLARGFGRQHLGPLGRRTFWGVGNRASLTTALTGVNNDMTFIARKTGTAGNSIRVAIVVSGNNTPLSVAVAGNDITINSATNGSAAPTSTAIDVVTAMLASEAAKALVWTQIAVPGNDGTGVVAALALTNLAGATA